MKEYFIILAVLLCSAGYGQQQYTVTGKVMDTDDQPLPGANIIIPELHTGTITDSTGAFVLEAMPSGVFTLQVSYLGHETVVREIDTDHDAGNVLIKMHAQPISGKAVVISGGQYSSQHENAIKIDAISANDLRQLNAPSLVESIAQNPGIDMISGGGAVKTPVIRGMSGSNILFLYNGVRLENYQFSSEHPYLADAMGISQVELIRGPASLLYGSDAIGGVINVIPEIPPDVNKISGDIRLRHFSNTEGYEGEAGLKGNTGKFTWGLRGNLYSHKDYYDGSGLQVPNSRYNGEGLRSFASLRRSRSLHRLYYYYQAMRAGMVNDESGPVITGNSRENQYWYQDLAHHMLISRSTLFFRHTRLQLNLAYQNNSRKLMEEASHKLIDMGLQTINYELKSITSLNQKMTFTAGLQGMNQFNRNMEAEVRVLPDYTRTDLALLGLLRLDLSSATHFQLGVRFDNRILNVPEQEKASHAHHDEAGEEDPEEHETMEPLNRYFGNLSFSAGLTRDITDALLLRLNLASAYRAPNVAELTQDGEHGTRYEQGDRDLLPQRNYEADLSIHFHTGEVMIDIAGFYNWVNDYIYLGPTADTSDDGDQIFRYLQSDAQLSGVEISAEFRPWDRWLLEAGYSMIYAFGSDGEYLPLMPQDKFTGRIGYLWSGSGLIGDFYLKVGGEYALDQNRTGFGEVSTSGYLLTNLMLGTTFDAAGQPIEFTLNISNLLNEDYADHLSVIKSLGYMNMGRSWQISCRVPFDLK